MKIKILILVFCVLVTSCRPIENRLEGTQFSASTNDLLAKMKNEDVIWYGTFVGLIPELTGATLFLVDAPEDITQYLIESLRDENKFVAAHVLLAYRTPEEKIFCKGEDRVEEWCGLKVQIYADGRTTFDGNNLRKLQAFWRKTLGR